MSGERVPFAKREEALRKLNAWGLDRAKEAVRRNYPAGMSEEMVEIIARLVLDHIGREQFARSKAGHQT